MFVFELWAISKYKIIIIEFKVLPAARKMSKEYIDKNFVEYMHNYTHLTLR